MAEGSRIFLILAAVLLILLGLLWGVHAVALFRGGPEAAPGIVAAAPAARGVAAGLLVVGVALLGAGVTVLFRSRVAWVLGVAAAVVFVVDGLVSNYVLFGGPRISHNATNMVVAALVIWLLSKGKPALGSTP